MSPPIKSARKAILVGPTRRQEPSDYSSGFSETSELTDFYKQYNQGWEILYLNIFFQKKINILFDSISAINILFLLSCNILEKQKIVKFFIGQRNIHLQGKHSNVVYLYKKSYTLEINSQICWQEVLLPVLSKLRPQNLS